MESKQYINNTKESLLDKIDNWYNKYATRKVNTMRFDVQGDIDLFQFRIVSAMERILRTDLLCDLTLSDAHLEFFKRQIGK